MGSDFGPCLVVSFLGLCSLFGVTCLDDRLRSFTDKIPLMGCDLSLFDAIGVFASVAKFDFVGVLFPEDTELGLLSFFIGLSGELVGVGAATTLALVIFVGDRTLSQ